MFIYSLSLLLANLPESFPVGSEPVQSFDQVSSASLFFKSILILLLFCAVFYVILKYFIPKSPWYKKNAASKIKIVDQVALETRKGLYWIKIENENFLIGSTDSQLTGLGQWSNSERKFPVIDP